MNVVKLIRNRVEPVKLIRQTGQNVRVVRVVAQPVRLVNTAGVVIYGGATNAAELDCATDLRTYYQLKKQS